MKKNCSIGRFVDWRKVALCLLSVAALNLQAGDVTVGIWMPMVPWHSPLWKHATVSWTGGDGSKTNVVTDLKKRLNNQKWHMVFQLPYGTENFVIIFTPDYGYGLDRSGIVEINKGEPVEGVETYLTDDQIPRLVVTGCYVDCSAAHATAAWTRGDGTVTNAVDSSGRFLVAKGETNVKIIYTPRWGYTLDKTEYEIAGPVNEDIKLLKEDLPKATKLEVVQPMTNVVQWGTWSMDNEDWVSPHGRFVDTPGQAMIDAYTEHLAANPGDAEATVCRAFARLKTLGENEGFVKLCEMYGYTFINEDMHFRGMLTDSTDIMDTTETIRTVCDEGEPLSEKFPIEGIGTLKVLEGVVADLDRVPKGWDGELVISPEEYPVDDTILFDYGDVQALKSVALEVSSILNIMKGYNMMLDKSMLRETFGALERSRSSDEIGYNGPKRFFDTNKDFMPNPWGAGSVRDARALALAQDQMHRALVAMKEFDDWQLNNREQRQWIRDRHWDDQDKYGCTTYHFVELDMSRWQAILGVFRRDADKIVNLPYFTYEVDGYEWSRLNFRPRPMRGMLRSKLKNYKYEFTLRSLFEGRLNRDHFPVFGGTTIATIGGGCHVAGHEFQIKDTPDPTLAGTFPGLTRRKLGAFLDQFCTVQKWDADDRVIENYLVKYEFNCQTDIVNTVRNPATIAADNPSSFYLLDPHVNGLEVARWEPGWLANHDGMEKGEIRRHPLPNHKPASPETDDAYFIFDNKLTYRPAWDPGAKFPTNRVGVCDWTWNADPVKAMDKIARGGRSSIVQISLSPWVWQGATEESWRLVRETLARFAPDLNPIRPSIGIRATSTMIDFPGEDYSSLHSISNTQGCLYGVLNGDVWQHDRWETNFLHVVKAAIMTKELGARRMSANIGFIAIDPDLMYERVKAICDECMRNGIDFLIEAGSQPSSDVLNLLSRLRNDGQVKNVALSFNPCEAVLYGAEDPVEAFRLLKDEIRQIRLRDCKSDRANWNDDCSWGNKGDFSARSDFDKGTFLETVRALGFTGDIFYERRSGADEPTSEEEEEIRRAMGRIYSGLGIDPYPWRISFDEHPRMNVAWTSGNGSVTNAVGGMYFEVKDGTANVKVIFTPKPGWELLDEGVFDLGTVKADAVFGEGGNYRVPSVRWSSPIQYIDENHEERTKAVGEFEVVSSDTRFLTNGWYAVVDDVDIREATNIIVKGDAKLILCDWASLAVTNAQIRHAAVSVGEGDALTIYGQTNGTGRLTVKGGSHASGIGASSSADGCGTVSIHGGTVTATGGTNASGIGGCYKSSGGSVTITGGRIAARAKSFSAADLGNGALSGEPPCAVTIYGGVFANRPENVWCYEGLGPVANPDPVTVTNYPYAIGEALRVTFGVHPNVSAAWTCGDGSVTNKLKIEDTYFTIPVPGTNDVKVIFTAANGCTLDGDAVANVGTVVDDVTFGVRNDFAVPRSVIRYRDWDAENCVMTNAMIAYTNVIMVTDKKPAEFADGKWYAVITNVTKAADDYSLPVSGSVHLILCDGATLAITNRSKSAAISVEGDASLTIYGQAEDSGLLAVKCGNSGAGIGSGNGGTCGAITIRGGTVDAVGGNYSAGVGCGMTGKGGSVTITGGRITATGHSADDIGCRTGTTPPCEVAIRGGIFAHALNDAWMVPGYGAVANTDETTKVEYPWAVADNRKVIMPGKGSDRCDTAADATNVMAGSIFSPGDEVIKKLGAGSSALREYSEMFRLGVVPQSDGKWTVEALLKPEPWTNVVESALEMTRQIPLEEIREFELGMPFSLTYWFGVPGFYYTFHSGTAVTNLLPIVSDGGRDVLCGIDEEVTFSGVTKPSDESGFFSVGVLEVPLAYIPGTDYTMTGKTPRLPPRPR